jgi:glutathione S-transferase
VVKLWGRKTSINVQKVMWTLAEAGVPYERIDAGGPFGRVDTPEFQSLNPNKLVPVLDDDGFSLWESNAIVRYLSRKYAGGALAPADPRQHALADQWMEWASTGLYGDVISVIFWGLIRTPATERNTEAIRVSVKRAGERLGVLDEQLSGRAYILGDQMTMADIGVGILMYRYFSLDIERPALPNVRAWHQRLLGRPAYTANAMVDYSSLKVAGA